MFHKKKQEDEFEMVNLRTVYGVYAVSYTHLFRFPRDISSVCYGRKFMSLYCHVFLCSSHVGIKKQGV